MRSIKAVQQHLKPADNLQAAPKAAAPADPGQPRGKRARTATNYAALEQNPLSREESAALKRALQLSRQEQQRTPSSVPARIKASKAVANGVLKASNGHCKHSGAPVRNEDGDLCASVRATKIEDKLAFDKARNPWTKVLLRVQRQISRLKTELHILQTYAADQNRPGKKLVKQTHESARCEQQVTKCKQVIRECLKECEEASGHRPIPDECFDANGEIDFAHILCSACSDPNADDTNDVLLCDGEFCQRAYHVRCLPVKDSFNVDDLPEHEGWLCPACDCRYDILWELAEAFDLDFKALIECRWQETLMDDEVLHHIEASTRPATILTAELPSDDESDKDFDEDADSDEEDDGDKAGPSGTGAGEGEAQTDGGGVARGANGDEGEDASDSGESSSDMDDEEEYQDDSDEDGPSAQQLLELLKQDQEAEPETLVVQGKRQRGTVDYKRLNAEMFGDVECYEGEGLDDDFAVGAGQSVGGEVR